MYYSAMKCFEGDAPPGNKECSRCFCPWSSGIAVTAVGPKILDGHHRWAATKLVAASLSQDLRDLFEGEHTNVLSYNCSVDKVRSFGNAAKHADCGVFGPAHEFAQVDYGP